MSEQTEQRDPMAEYQAQLEEHEFLKREGLKAWVDVILDMLGDKVSEDRRPLIVEGIARFMGVGAPRLPGLDGPMSYIVGGPPQQIDAEFLEPFFEEKEEDGRITRVYDWPTIAAGATHAVHSIGFSKPVNVDLYYYDEHLMQLTGPAAESFWNWQEKARSPQGSPLMLPRRIMRRG